MIWACRCCGIPWVKMPRPMGLERGWLRWCESSPSIVGLRGLHGLQDAASFKMVALRDRISRNHSFVPRARHFTKSHNTVSTKHGRAPRKLFLLFFFLPVYRFPSIKILTLENDFHKEISSCHSRVIDRLAHRCRRNVAIQRGKITSEV